MASQERQRLEEKVLRRNCFSGSRWQRHAIKPPLTLIRLALGRSLRQSLTLLARRLLGFFLAVGATFLLAE